MAFLVRRRGMDGGRTDDIVRASLLSLTRLREHVGEPCEEGYMDSERFDRIGQALGNGSKRRWPLGSMLGIAFGGLHAARPAA